MYRRYSLPLAALCALHTLSVARAQTATVSIPAWIETNDCATTPKFEATLNGKPASVVSQLGPSTDQVVLVVLDLTGNMSLVEPAKQGLINKISKLPGNTWVGLLRDQDGLHVLADPSPNRHPAIQAIESASSGNEPGLLGTVHSALSLADAILRKSLVRVSVLYITDGSIYRYREDYTNPVINQSDPHDLSRRFPEVLINDKISRVIDDIDSFDVPLFVVHLSYRRDRLNEAYQNGLQNLADSSGGESVICRSVAEIPEAISDMFDRISRAWRVTVAVPANIHSDVQVELSAPCRDGGAGRISSRTHFHPKEG
jgi:hypothetical protein